LLEHSNTRPDIDSVMMKMMKMMMLYQSRTWKQFPRETIALRGQGMDEWMHN
jgi:hypothetical protein